jgi:protein-S-isoprenylcysteine O-methyltransferase Ste14
MILLVQSVPAWTGLMTLPFAAYLITIFTNLPESLPRTLLNFLNPINVPEKALVVAGLLLLAISVAHLRSRRGEGLVTSGPYGLVRHPQYLGMILATLGLTGMSVWILNNTFGIGFLSPAQTIAALLAELLAYVLLAYVEERHLSGRHGEAHDDYRSRVPFLVPLLKTQRMNLEVAISIAAPAILLFVLIWAQ